MSNKLLTIVYAGALALGFTSAALANMMCCNKEEEHMHHKHHHCMHQDVVISSNGHVVYDSFGGCVRTRYLVPTEKCCSHRHHKHADVMHMEERIIYFDFNKSDLKDSEKAKLDVLADAIKADNIHAVKVVGYTDRIGKAGHNRKLSHQRADSVRNYLGSKVKLQSNVVALRGLGESHQVKSCHGVKDRGELINCLAPNRRVEVEVDYTAHRK